MKSSILHTFVFSPTGTSRKIAMAAARGFGAAQTQPTDTTHRSSECAALPGSATALFAVPVYGGKVAPTALKRIESVRGEGTPALLVVLYGNRAFGHALKELAEAVAAQGFIPVAAAAFVGEHSYSTSGTPIAAGRPDAKDLAQAEAWGRCAAEHLTVHGAAELDVRQLKQPASGFPALLRFGWFALRYMKHQKKHPVVRIPQTSDACTGCGHCAEICPTQAIAPGDERRTDPSRCIRCCACVKECPIHARSYDTPFAPVLARNFARPKPNVMLPRP